MFQAIADGNVTVSIGSVTVSTGNIVCVDVSVQSNTNYTYLVFENISYDESALELIELSLDNSDLAASNYQVFPFDEVMTANGVELMFDNNGEPVNLSGTALTIKFKVKDTAKVGDYKISLDSLVLIVGKEVPSSFVSGVITVLCSHANKTLIPEKAANCSTGGNKAYYTCNGCGKVFKADGVTETTVQAESIPTTNNHTYGAWTKVDDNNHKHTCSVCGKSETAAHKWDAGKVTKEPTCKETGVKTYTCTDCGATKTESIAVTGNHTYGAWTKVDDNNHKHTCSVCGKSETAKHNFNKNVVVKYATEDEEGLRRYTCSDCGQAKDEVIPKADHVHQYVSEWINDSSNHWKVCKCGDKGLLAAHEYYNGKETVEATCVSTGIMTCSCSVCGYTKTEEIPTSNEHAWGEWNVAKEATETEKGIKVRSCSLCGKEETMDIPVKIGEFKLSDLNMGDKLEIKQEGETNYLCGIGEKTSVKNENIKVYGQNGKLKTAGDIGTGNRVVVTDKNGKVTLDAIAIVKGDIDGDGKVSATDYVKVRLAILKKLEMNNAQSLAARVTGGKNITIKDYVNIRLHILKKIFLYD